MLKTYIVCLAQGVQIPCLRDGTCPFDDCDEPYRDFIGWYLHCTSKHPEYILAAGRSVPYTLTTEERERLPMFRCTTCFMCVPLAQVYRHHEKCAARMLPESIGPRKDMYPYKGNVKPDFSNEAACCGLQYGTVRARIGVWSSRDEGASLCRTPPRGPCFCTRPSTDGGQPPRDSERPISAQVTRPQRPKRKSEACSFTRRNQGAPVSSVLYVVSRIRHNNVPEIGEWAKDRIVYVGSTTDVTARVRKHTADTVRGS